MLRLQCLKSAGSCQIDDRAHRQRIFHVERAAVGKTSTRGAPYCEMAATGAPYEHDMLQIQSVLMGDGAQVIDGCADVAIGAGPAAALVVDPTILDVPGCNAGLTQG